jgi:PAS domain S-box-containing protein
VKLFEESAAHRVGLTGNGSFVTNHASLSETSPESTGGPRLCIRAVAGGYQSIALIPLRFGDGLLGVLQCGDTGQDRLTPDLIAFLERSAGSIATALEQQKAQAALATSEERLRLISEYTADVIWVADLRTRQFTYVSPSVTRARGYTPEELVNQHVLSLASSVAPEAREHVLGEIERHAINFASGVASTATFTLLIPQIQKDCSIVPTETALTFLPGPDGRPREILGVSRDITERVRAEREKASLLEELRQAQKLESIGRLAGGIAHDFNNLLTVINGNSSLAAEALPADGLLAELVGEISQAGVRAAGLTQQLLAFSRKELAEPTVVSLNRQIIEIRDVFQRLLGEDIELVTDLQDDLWPVLADPGHIHQVLLNLGVNSRDAMPRGGVLTFRTSNTILDAVPGVASGQDSNEFVMLEVSDTGVGIEPSVAGRVFEPFFTTKHDKGGTGLGLSTVYGIVRQCQGWIRLRSEPGVGTTFIILLPRAVDPYEAELLIAAESSAHLHGSETILVAEDQGQVRKITGLILKKHGYRVYLAASGPEALSFAAEFSEPIDLLVTDIVMPGMNGFELADRLRALRPGIRTLYTSGYPDKVADLQGISPTALRYLPKPFTAQSLVTMVREALAGGGVGRAPSPDPLVRLPKG